MVNNWWCLLAIWLWLIKWYTSDTPNADGKRNRLTWVPTYRCHRKIAVPTCFAAAEVFSPLTSVEMVMEKNIPGSCKPRWWNVALKKPKSPNWWNAGVFPGNDQKYDQFKIYKGFLKVDITRFKVPKMDCTDTRVEAFWREERGSRIGRGKDGGKWQ